MSDVETAERITRKRARMVMVLAVIFIGTQAVYFGKAAKFDALGDMRTVDAVHISAWLVMAAALLALLLTGGGWFRGQQVRALVDDESTREHRRKALSVGFVAAMANCAGLYFATFFEPISGREAVHLTMTIGIGAALLSFGTLERMALKDG